MIVVDLIKEIVAKVSTNLTPDLQSLDSRITGVHFMNGHPLEVIETLAQKDKSNTFRFEKYPLIALFQDFAEVHTGNIGAPLELTLHLIIARATRPEYKASERYEKNFKPFLYPIYNEFLRQLNLSGLFMIYNSSIIPHTKYDRLYWGKEGLFKNQGNIFDDYLDVIELKNLKLKLYKKTCKKWLK